MLKAISIFCKNVLYALLLLSFIAFVSPKLRAQANITPKIKCVVLDPGHGGKDYGCISKDRKYNEKSIVLSVALKLGSMIEKKYPDIKVVYTRKKDIFIPLDERANIANKNKADLFLSIHVNATTGTEAHGTETFTMGNHVSKGNFELSKRENSVILLEDNYNSKYEGFKPDSPESYIIFSLLQNAYAEKSIKFAQYIQNQFSKGPIKFNRGVKQAGFLVLWKTTMPSVLTELGFISNPNDLKILVSEKGQRELAERLMSAFENYKRDYEAVGTNERATPKRDTSTSTSEDSVKQENIQGIKQENIQVEENVQGANIEESKLAEVQDSSNDKIVYHIQVMSVGRRLKSTDRELRGRKDLKFIVEKGLYKYYIGDYSTKDEALADLDKVRSSFKGAFIIGSRNGKIVYR